MEEERRVPGGVKVVSFLARLASKVERSFLNASGFLLVPPIMDKR